MYRAKWACLDVAVKVIQHSQETTALVRNEVELMMSLNHPNIVRAYHCITQRRKPGVAASRRASRESNGKTSVDPMLHVAVPGAAGSSALYEGSISLVTTPHTSGPKRANSFALASAAPRLAGLKKVASLSGASGFSASAAASCASSASGSGESPIQGIQQSVDSYRPSNLSCQTGSHHARSEAHSNGRVSAAGPTAAMNDHCIHTHSFHRDPGSGVTAHSNVMSSGSLVNPATPDATAAVAQHISASGQTIGSSGGYVAKRSVSFDLSNASGRTLSRQGSIGSDRPADDASFTFSTSKNLLARAHSTASGTHTGTGTGTVSRTGSGEASMGSFSVNSVGNRSADNCSSLPPGLPHVPATNGSATAGGVNAWGAASAVGSVLSTSHGSSRLSAASSSSSGRAVTDRLCSVLPPSSITSCSSGPIAEGVETPQAAAPTLSYSSVSGRRHSDCCRDQPGMSLQQGPDTYNAGSSTHAWSVIRDSPLVAKFGPAEAFIQQQQAGNQSLSSPDNAVGPGDPAGNVSAETWLVLELCDKGTLSSNMQQWKRHGEGEEQMLQRLMLLQDAARGLALLHGRNIVHGDLVSCSLSASLSVCIYASAAVRQLTCIVFVYTVHTSVVSQPIGLLTCRAPHSRETFSSVCLQNCHNVLVSSSSTARFGLVGKLSDFGLSRVIKQAATHRTTRTVSATAYPSATLTVSATWSVR